jgi:hypothetical protein
MLSVTPFKDPKVAILTLKINTGNLLVILYNPTKSRLSQLLCIFLAANERSAQENIDQSQRRKFCGGFQ